MPKINVYPPQPNPDRRVEVGWHPHGTVQIATTALVNSDVILPSNPPITPEPKWDGGNFVDLDRVGINNLIRALRTARDKAFGRDE